VKVAELAAESGLSRQWLNKLVDRGMVPGVRRGTTGRLIIRRDAELDGWLRLRWGKVKIPLSAAQKEVFQRAKQWMNRPDVRYVGKIGLLIHALFESDDLEEKFPETYAAFWNLSAAEGFKALQSDPAFRKFKNHPVLKWICTARTQKARDLRQDVALYQYSRGKGGFSSLSDIARKHNVTRAAASKAYRQMLLIADESKQA
jgi:hypothetical protein